MSIAAIILLAGWAKIILVTAGLIIVTVAVMGAGAYVFVRIIASIMNSRRDSWESSADRLSLIVDRSAGAICKPFSGEREGRQVTVSHFAVMRGEYSSDDYAAVEIAVSDPPTFSFEIEKPETLLSDLFDPGHPETGHDIFDKVFMVSASHIASLNEMLHVELKGGESPTLLTDLLLAAKRFHRVKVTDRSVVVGIRADFGQSDIIESAIKKASYIASRIEAANKKVSRATR